MVLDSGVDDSTIIQFDLLTSGDCSPEVLVQFMACIAAKTS